MWDSIVASSLVCGVFILLFWILSWLLQRYQVKKSKQYFEQLQNSTKIGAKVILLNGIVGVIKSIDEQFIELQIAPNVKITCVRFSIKQVIK